MLWEAFFNLVTIKLYILGGFLNPRPFHLIILDGGSADWARVYWKNPFFMLIFFKILLNEIICGNITTCCIFSHNLWKYESIKQAKDWPVSFLD